MNDRTPHYVLLAEAGRNDRFGHWRFVLRPSEGATEVEVSDVEPNAWGDRLNLLTVVRGLELLDQPSHVTVVGCTRYVEQGIKFGMAEWRDNDWRWEYFGQMTPVRDADLWQRMDRIQQFHRVDCGKRRFDSADGLLNGPHWGKAGNGKGWVDRIAGENWLKYRASVFVARCVVWMEAVARFWHRIVEDGNWASRVRTWWNAAWNAIAKFRTLSPES